MAKGHENLIPLTARTSEQQREITRLGGLKSGEARRKQKEIKDLLNFIDVQPLPDNITSTDILKMENATIRDGIIITLINKILVSEDLKAIELYLKLKGEYPKDIEISNKSLTVIWNEKRYENGLD